MTSVARNSWFYLSKPETMQRHFYRDSHHTQNKMTKFSIKTQFALQRCL